jgi:(1->4)-alpha-D-glucan 1-alpha-D-glucosylmutase
VVAPDDRAGAVARRAQADALLRDLAALPDAGAELDRCVERMNADLDRLDELLEQQNYRLARWQTAGFELDYRRFFDVNDLAALRAEDPEVFAETHRRVLGWLEDGSLDGVRIDHPDGLRDPRAYFDRLHAASPQAWIVAEKILAPDERLPEDWAVAGTTGYDFLNRVLGLFVDPRAEQSLSDLYVRFTGEIASYPDVAYEKKQQAMQDLLGSEITLLGELFVRVCEGNRRYRDFTRRELVECLTEVIACLPVYRTYAVPETGEVSDQDLRFVEAALAEDARRRPELDAELLGLLGRILVLEERAEHTGELVARFQQTSGPVAAKGVEDGAFYAYNRLHAGHVDARHQEERGRARPPRRA